MEKHHMPDDLVLQKCNMAYMVDRYGLILLLCLAVVCGIIGAFLKTVMAVMSLLVLALGGFLAAVDHLLWRCSRNNSFVVVRQADLEIIEGHCLKFLGVRKTVLPLRRISRVDIGAKNYFGTFLKVASLRITTAGDITEKQIDGLPNVQAVQLHNEIKNRCKNF